MPTESFLQQRFGCQHHSFLPVVYSKVYLWFASPLAETGSGATCSKVVLSPGFGVASCCLGARAVLSSSLVSLGLCVHSQWLTDVTGVCCCGDGSQ